MACAERRHTTRSRVVGCMNRKKGEGKQIKKKTNGEVGQRELRTVENQVIFFFKVYLDIKY